ncbi:ATP-dependent DNA helicase [Bradyrhizobium sp. SZCCHNR2012]|uniref:ATP-dependent helicase n=1 Tax=Bradyrhizobium sp. SZCCHNR2012 TaxID=3057377 RepID=UPI0028E9D588|nr:ATP-dependent DNA helicase [Bradyrhizobium sp. SZCCHNR2012]
MPLPSSKAKDILVKDLNRRQKEAVSASQQQLLVIAGAGSGKTEVMARRVAWWVAIEGVPKEQIAAFTFTEAAAEELKFRIRTWLQEISSPDEDPTLGGMYIGTIHGFCLKALRELAEDEYYLFDVLDEAGRASLIEQGYNGILALRTFEAKARDAGMARGKFDAVDLFLRGYDLLNEYAVLSVDLADEAAPSDVGTERDWCKEASLATDVGQSELAQAFAVSTARYYAYLKARRFLDFSTVQSEIVARLKHDTKFAKRTREKWSRIVVDEVQDINPVQFALIQALRGAKGYLTAVGDHRQAIYSFRGGRIDLMGRLYAETRKHAAGKIVELSDNYRSTPRIIRLSNLWSDTIQDRAGMSNPAMEHGRTNRIDTRDQHVALLRFDGLDDEATWIAETIKAMTSAKAGHGAHHDGKGGPRGIGYSDIAILVRSSTDIRAYQDALRAVGVPAVVRGGPDLFSQVEVLLFLSAFAICAGIDQFFGSPAFATSLPSRVQRVLGVPPEPEKIVPAAIAALASRGIAIDAATSKRLLLLAKAIQFRTLNDGPIPFNISSLRCVDAARWLRQTRKPRRVFPQTLFHWLLHEASIYTWKTDQNKDLVEAALFHVGQLSTLIKGLETSGWTPAESLKWQLIALTSWGASSARAAEAPLLVSPNAVTITTVHSAKGLEFPAVFLADVKAQRLPSSRAGVVDNVPFDAKLQKTINPALLADNANYDNERRLMYVAMTRAERYLFITYSGKKTSKFIKELSPLARQVGAVVQDGGINIRKWIEHYPVTSGDEDRLATNFSELRYFMECPHDFYLRNVLGFTPTIGQEFGYGRGVHNLLRAVHAAPKKWAAIAMHPEKVEHEIRKMIAAGMFYMRYTTADPLLNLQNKAVTGLVEYVKHYADELARLNFEPEREFETLLADEKLLVSGTIDVLRLDDPPRVTIIDFKSGDAKGQTGSGLTKELMATQIGVYGLAAKHELEYDPQKGMVRYIGERDPTQREMPVDLSEKDLVEVRGRLVETAKKIRDRDFHQGPTELAKGRCGDCDFFLICDRPEAAKVRTA